MFVSTIPCSYSSIIPCQSPIKNRNISTKQPQIKKRMKREKKTTKKQKEKEKREGKKGKQNEFEYL